MHNSSHSSSADREREVQLFWMSERYYSITALTYYSVTALTNIFQGYTTQQTYHVSLVEILIALLAVILFPLVRARKLWRIRNVIWLGFFSGLLQGQLVYLRHNLDTFR